MARQRYRGDRGGIGALLASLLLVVLFLLAGCSAASTLPGGSVAAPTRTPPVKVVERGSGSAQALVTTPIATTGCGTTPPTPPGTTRQQSLFVGHRTRSYLVHIPAGYDSATPTPLVLSFHGHGSSDYAQERATGLSLVADQQHFVAVYPQGLVGPDGRDGWNTGRFRDPPANDVGFVSALLNHLQGTLCVDARRMYATGFSNGGGFTAILACDFSARFAAFGIVSGDYYPQRGGCHPADTVSLVEVHGTADHVNPYNGSTVRRYPPVQTWLIDWALRDGCVSSSTVEALRKDITTQTWNHCRDGAVLMHYKLIGGQHAWPTSGIVLASSASPANSGRDTLAPSVHYHPPLKMAHVDVTFAASQVIWSFLAQHALSDAPGATTTNTGHAGAA